MEDHEDELSRLLLRFEKSPEFRDHPWRREFLDEMEEPFEEDDEVSIGLDGETTTDVEEFSAILGPRFECRVEEEKEEIPNQPTRGQNKRRLAELCIAVVISGYMLSDHTWAFPLVFVLGILAWEMRELHATPIQFRMNRYLLISRPEDVGDDTPTGKN